MKIGVVGGGLAGLAAALALSRTGHETTVFEKNGKIGGCCAETLVDGFRFNDGAMFVALPRLLDYAFSALGLDRAKVVPLTRIAIPHAAEFSDGRCVVLGAARPDGDLATLVARWRPVLQRLVNDVLPYPLSTLRTLRAVGRYLPRLRGTVAGELERTVRDPSLRAALASALAYTGVPVERLPVSQIVGLIALLDDGLYLPEHGMSAIPRALADALHAAGGQIVLGAGVERIEISGGRAVGLTVSGRGGMPFDAVVSTISGMHTSCTLLDKESVPASMRRRVERAPLSHSAVSVQLGLSAPIAAPAYTTLLLEHGISYTTTGNVVEMYVPFDPNRSVHAVADTAVELLRARHAFRVDVRRVRGPAEFERDMHLFRSAIYGLSPAAKPSVFFPHATPIGGLNQAGQTTWPGFGMATAMLSGIFAAEAGFR